jgi:hypothetical protein
MREPTKFVLTAIALMWLMVFPRPGAAQALQEIRIGSSVIGFSSLMSYFARDLKFFERRPRCQDHLRADQRGSGSTDRRQL